MEPLENPVFFELVVRFSIAVFLIFVGIFLAIWWRSRLKKESRHTLEDDFKSVEKLANSGGLTPEEQKRIRQAMAEKLAGKLKDKEGGGQL